MVAYRQISSRHRFLSTRKKNILVDKWWKKNSSQCLFTYFSWTLLINELWVSGVLKTEKPNIAHEMPNWATMYQRYSSFSHIPHPERPIPTKLIMDRKMLHIVYMYWKHLPLVRSRPLTVIWTIFVLANGIRAEHAVAKILVHNFSPPKFLIVFIVFKHILSFLDTYKVVSAFFKKTEKILVCVGIC